MSLYVWEGVLTDYTPGVIFALAASADGARVAVRRAESEPARTDKKGRVWPAVVHPDHDCGCKVCEEMRVAPDVYDSPAGFAVWGGS